ncbi:outer membrane beta-barrel family protein [Pedobacter foliorum]|uniref:outer membrane beta-barrel family protein n=1 Tax=Pedobacter foliorum TaxID=2739058 RepID=UPI0015679A83|nr:outer membrane beta-barrel family protein [Pedobacter foliorum]NRF37719.1 outer membrane beta-barrel protein [Pedobacter foliorum]
MKRYIFILMGFLLPFFSIAQLQSGPGSSLVGKVVDSETKQPLALATVTIFDLKKDSGLVATESTTPDGNFLFKLKPGLYLAKISLVGYLRSTSKPFEISITNAKQDSLLVSMHKSQNELTEVVINGANKTIAYIPGGYKFNVDKSIGATGSVFELLRQVPGVTIDGSNSIKLQGKGPTVLVNGRKVNITGDDLAAYLKSISATQVADIAVNSNPNAKFDSAGEGGILDIKLKQHRVPGFYGNISSNISTLVSTDNSANVNFKRSKWDISGSYSYTYKEDFYHRSNYYENRNLPDSLYIFRQKSSADRNQKSSYIRTGLTYEMDSTSLVTFNFFGARFNLSSPSHLTSEIFNRADIFQNNYLQNESNLTHNNFYINDLLYKKTFRNKDILNLGFNYSKYSNRSDRTFNRRFYDINNHPVSDNYEDNRMINTLRPYKLTATNIDYTANISKSMKLDLGTKFTHTSTGSYFINAVYDTLTNIYVNDPILSNRVDYRENITAIYGLLSGKLKKFNYQLGLRYEGFNYSLTSPSLTSPSSNSYSNFFPSLNLSLASSDHQSNYSLNLGRRIQRPGYSMLNPFLNVISLGQYSSGNPYLKPYLINKGEFQFSRSYGNGNFFMASLFVANSSNIYSAVFKYDPVTNMNFDTYENFRSTQQYGGYLVLQNTVTKWFNLNAYLAGTQSTFSTKISDDILFPGNLSFTGNLSLNFTAKNTKFQVYGYCVTANNYFQLKNATNGNISIAVQQKLFKSRMTASLNFEDILNINQFPVTVNTTNVYIHSLNKLQSQYVRFGFNYAFGKSFNSKSLKDLKKDSRID